MTQPTIRIPKNLDDLEKMFTTRDNNIEGLLTARQWVRAFIIYAHCARMQGIRTSPENRGGKKLSFKEFADRGYNGMTHVDTVGHYYSVVERLIMDGALPEPQCGETVEIPDLPWPGSKKKPGGPTPAAAARQYIRTAERLIVDKDRLEPEKRAAVLEAAESIVAAFRGSVKVAA